MENLIRKLSMTKEEERNENIPRYKKLFEQNSYYSAMVSNELSFLSFEVLKYNNAMDFYRAVALQFVKQYIPLLINEYKSRLDDSTINKLLSIMSGEGLKVFSQGQAVLEGYIQTDANGNKKGDDGAFSISELGIIGFTPESLPISDDLSLEEKRKEMVANALRMKGSMIHETFHLLINVMLEERFKWKSNGVGQSSLTSGGFILNEGLVEQHAMEFSKKYHFVHNPALDYFHYIDFCNELRRRLGENSFEEMSFQSNYMEILSSVLTIEQVNLYRLEERKKYLEKRKITSVDSIPLEEQSIALENNIKK